MHLGYFQSETLRHLPCIIGLKKSNGQYLHQNQAQWRTIVAKLWISDWPWRQLAHGEQNLNAIGQGLEISVKLFAHAWDKSATYFKRGLV